MPTLSTFYPSVTSDGNAKTIEAPNSSGDLKSKITNSQSDQQDAAYAKPETYAAVDTGKVRVWLGMVISDPCFVEVFSTSDDLTVGLFGGADDGKHWYYDGQKSESSTPKHKFAPAGDGRIYLSHPRFKWGPKSDMPDKAWNYPRTVAMVTKDMGTKAQPYDFGFDIALPIKASFKTRNGKGDSEAGGKMAAIAGGLVYYHKPEPRGSGSSDQWKETPSFWNPFWRAKLHPVGQGDAASALVDHSASLEGSNFGSSYIYY
jgi:hypothetical protein